MMVSEVDQTIVISTHDDAISVLVEFTALISTPGTVFEQQSPGVFQLTTEGRLYFESPLLLRNDTSGARQIVSGAGLGGIAANQGDTLCAMTLVQGYPLWCEVP